ncbi:MAG: hypothetical protein LUE11_08945 [Clostridia bacterium]|nr:hypothetical protein [Clostridia bacterium]
MEYVICCLCSLLCFACGVWAARGGPHLPRRRKKQNDAGLPDAEDALSRDIAALLAYTGPGKEENHADS